VGGAEQQAERPLGWKVRVMRANDAGILMPTFSRGARKVDALLITTDPHLRK